MDSIQETFIYEQQNKKINIIQEEAWAAGGSGVLLKSKNGGKNWTRQKAADEIAANLYNVK